MSKKDLEITVGEIRKAIPEHLFKKNEYRFLVSVGHSLGLTLLLAFLAYYLLPLSCWAIPLWIAYALLTGTVATGLWVLGHECGHGAFSEKQWLNDSLGFIIHSALLVPYFSWQHSHAVHHAKTNHLTEGESHNPTPLNSKSGKVYQKLKDILGVESFACLQIFNISVLGWPLYLLIGATGGPARGFTSHFIVPNKLFPSRLLFKVTLSNLGLAICIYGLYQWAQYTSFVEVIAVYLGPYMVVNAWLTIITFLQHTDADVPHYDEKSWTWLKGALSTIDRNYPAWIDSLQFEIGTTHVVHHLFSDIPHYNAKEANVYLKKTIGQLYNSDSKSLWSSLYKSAQLVGVEDTGNGVWKFVQ